MNYRLVNEYHLGVVVALVACMLAVPASAGQEGDAGHGSILTIPFEGRSIGAVEEVRIVPDSDDPSRLGIHLTAEFPRFTATLDRALRARGNLGNCAHRFFWVGNSRVRGAGTSLRIHSRVRYESWQCTIGRSRNFRMTRTVDWELFVDPAGLDSLRIGARVRNIIDLPDWLEDLLGLRVQQRIQIPLLEGCEQCGCIQEQLHVRSGGTRFARDGKRRTRPCGAPGKQ